MLIQQEKKAVLLYEGETTQETGREGLNDWSSESSETSAVGDKRQGKDKDTALCSETESDLGGESARELKRKRI